MSILTTAAASTLPGLPIVWKDFQAANQPKRKSSQLKLLNPSRDHVESVIAYNYHRDSHDELNDWKSFGARGHESCGSAGTQFDRLGAFENPNTPSKESPPQPSGPFLSIDILV